MSISFEIQENTVMKYVGDDTSFIIPNIYNINGIANPITTIKDSMLKCSKKVEKVIVSDGIVTIEKEAFSSCPNMIDIELPSSILNIGKRAFYGCSNLTKIDIPPLLKTIEERTFSYCLKLKKINFLGNRILSIKSGAFRYCDSLNVVILPEGVKMIDEFAFSECRSLEKIYIPSSVTKIANNTFSSSSKVVIYTPFESYAWEFANKMKIECIIVENGSLE